MVLVLLKSGQLEIWHLYCLNALNGLMGTVQQPAGDVAISLITPREHYQKVSGLRSFSNSLVNILSPVAATSIFAAFGLDAVIYFDLSTFTVAFIALCFFVDIPIVQEIKDKGDSLIESAKDGLRYLKEHRGILDLILFWQALI